MFGWFKPDSNLYAFHPEVRKFMFARDKGICQCPDCIGNYTIGMPRNYTAGWHGQMAHYPAKHKRGVDNDPSNGRMLCTH